MGIVAFLPNFAINVAISAYSIKPKYGNIVAILFFVIVPLGIKSEGMISEYRFDKFCEKNYEYKIYKKLELPRKYFHEATTQEISQSNGKLKAADLVPNMEYIDADVFYKNIKDNFSFRQDAVYVISFFPKECINEYKTLDIDLDKYGVFMCGGLIYDEISNYKKKYSYNINMNAKEIVGELTTFKYNGSYLNKFIGGSTKTKECASNDITSIGSIDFIKFNGKE